MRSVFGLTAFAALLAVVPSQTPMEPTASIAAQTGIQEYQARMTLSGHTDMVNFVAVSPDGKKLASVSRDNTVRLWDFANGKERAVLRQIGGVNHLAFRPDSQTLTWANGSATVEVFDLSSEKIISTVKASQKSVKNFAFNPSGKILATGAGDESVKLWDTATGQNIATFDGPPQARSSGIQVAFSPDGKMLAALGKESKLSIWELATGKQRATFDGHIAATALAFSADSKLLAAASSPGGSIQIWDVYAGQKWAMLRGHNKYIGSLAFSPNGRTLLSGSQDNTAKLWHLATGTTMATLKPATFPVQSVAFSPDGKTLVSTSFDQIKLWDLPSAKLEPDITQLISGLGNEKTTAQATKRLIDMGVSVLDRLQQAAEEGDAKTKEKAAQLVTSISGGKTRLPVTAESKPVVVDGMEFTLIADKEWTVPDGAKEAEVDITLKITNRSDHAQRVALYVRGISLTDSAREQRDLRASAKSVTPAPRISEPLGKNQSVEVPFHGTLLRSTSLFSFRCSDAFGKIWSVREFSKGRYTLTVVYDSQMRPTKNDGNLWVGKTEASIEGLTVK